jgi:glycosyltransferase involved in cell wall biosynthesis
MTKRPKIVFLYSEIAGYFVACANELSKSADVLIVRWPVNSEAPFEFNINPNIDCVKKNDLSFIKLQKKVSDFLPDIVVCSGWMDKDYLKIVKSFDKSIPAVLTLDNHWKGSFKQQLASFGSPFFLKNKFTHAWVPGKPQKKFAEKLGFNNIIQGFYCADVELYNDIYENQDSTFEKTFLYVGRYVKHKGIFEMWQAFIELQKEYPNDWKLKCIGVGDEWDNKLEHEKIEHLGFVQPAEMKQHLKSKFVYILPSKFEPWGVTVQEFSIASCPLIISENVGAHELFLKGGENGVLISEVTVKNLKNALKSFIDKTEEELLNMSKVSHELGMSYTPEIWSDRLLKILE